MTWLCQPDLRQNPKQLLKATHLCHGHSSFLCEGVVIQVYNLKQWVDSKGLCQCCYARMVNSILWHVDLFQSPNDLGKDVDSVLENILQIKTILLYF